MALKFPIRSINRLLFTVARRHSDTFCRNLRTSATTSNFDSKGLLPNCNLLLTCNRTVLQNLSSEIAPPELPVSATMDADQKLLSGKRQRTTSTGSTGSKKSMQINPKRKDILWPPMRKGMTDLNPSAFDKDILVPTIAIFEDQMNPEVLRQVKPYLLKIPGMKPVQVDEKSETGEDGDENNQTTSTAAGRATKKMFLNPDLVKKQDFSSFVAQEMKLDSKVIAGIRRESVKFTYENWSWNQIFDSILPDDEDKVSGFSHVGHIIHLNLRDHHLPYKHIIGKIFLDKISNAKTVVNKLSNIDTTYRNFQMEILAGDPNTVVHLKENRCEYEFDFAHVYWNPRLSSEHERLVKFLNQGDVLYDVFAGVGPFAVPASKKKCTVLANDLNPESFKWLEHNVKKNKAQSLVRCFNQDGRVFINQTLAGDLIDTLGRSIDADNPDAFDFSNKKFHVAMNLPAMAVEFLDSFWGILQNIDEKIINPNLVVVVLVYCFIKDIEGFKEKALALVEEKLNFKLPKNNVLEVQFVRNVAPNKEMLRVSFVLPHTVMKSSIDSNPLKRKHSEIEERVE